MAPCYWATADTVDTVRADLLDLALLVIAVGFAVSGYRQGFIVGSLSFVGFVGGAVLGAEFGPSISRAIVGGQTQQDVVAVILLIVFAIVGQFVFSSVGAYVRQSMTSPSSTVLDSVGGSLVSVLSMLLIAWAIGSVLTASSFQGVVTQVDNSAVLGTMDKVMPSQAKTMFSEFRRLLASGPFPQVFSGIGAAHLFAISRAGPGGAEQPRVPDRPQPGTQGAGHRAELRPQHRGLWLRLRDASHPDQRARGRRRGPGAEGDHPERARSYPRKVVLYDPQVDIAVLYVPGLNLTPLQFDYQGQAGASAVVAGYPEDQGFTQDAARIGGTQNAVGPDIYQTGQVNRQIFEIRSNVEPGNSGGPLLSPSGTVYGVVFAAAVDASQTGFALTAQRGRRRREGRRQPDLPDFHPGL